MVNSKYSLRFSPTLSPIYEESFLNISDIELVFDKNDSEEDGGRRKGSAAGEKLALQKRRLGALLISVIVLLCITAFGFFLIKRALEMERNEGASVEVNQVNFDGGNLNDSASSFDTSSSTTVGIKQRRNSSIFADSFVGKFVFVWRTLL